MSKLKLKERASDEKGAALLTVLIAMMIMTLVLFEFQYNSMVERKLAYNELNQIQAYYLAKAGVRVGMLRVTLFGRLSRDSSIKNIAGGTDITPFLNQVWQIPLPPFPPDPESLGSLLKQDKDAAETTLEQTKITNGQVAHTIRTEGSKINLNFLVIPKELKGEPIDLRNDANTLFEYVAKSLVNLIQGFIDESEDPYTEFDNIQAEEVVYNIMDWVNSGSTALGGGSKDSFYERQNPPYKAKRNRFYTLDELRLVKGINENLYRKLRSYVTVFSYDGKININEASDEILRALYPDFTPEDLKEIRETKAEIGGMWTSEKQFVNYITETLGRTRFGTIYSDEKLYPFTVGSQSFVVESLGIIKKSASSVQRSIKVALAMAGGTNQQADFSNITNPNTCRSTPGAFFDGRFSKCVPKAYNADDCVNRVAGSPSENNGQFCCNVNRTGLICVTEQEKNNVKQANNLKLLHWSES